METAPPDSSHVEYAPMQLSPAPTATPHPSTTEEIAAMSQIDDSDTHNVNLTIHHPHTSTDNIIVDATTSAPTATNHENPNPVAIHTSINDTTITTNTTILFPLSEFADDIDQRLGRANGNIFHRKPGVEGVHDGQIMVRLKKKRFIIIDYSIVPNAADVAAAAMNPRIMCPNGAGKQKCVSPDCTKVGVPVMLYDSDPEQTSSLYLRNGLCFTCQRLLNEKRRTQRKRKCDMQGPNNGNGAGGAIPGQGAVDANGNPVAYGIDQGQKNFRLNGEILDLNPDAIIINGPLEGTKHHGPGYEYSEIVSDLQTISQEVSAETAQLASSVTALQEASSVENSDNVVLEEKANNILAIYDKTFLSMSKGIFLLSQWKSSWDSAVATAVAEKAEQQAAAAAAAADSSILDGSVIAEAVASAAAVAAAQSAGETSSNMIPLLLAADANKEAKKVEEEHEVIAAPPPEEENPPDTEIFTV